MAVTQAPLWLYRLCLPRTASSLIIGRGAKGYKGVQRGATAETTAQGTVGDLVSYHSCLSTILSTLAQVDNSL